MESYICWGFVDQKKKKKCSVLGLGQGSWVGEGAAWHSTDLLWKFTSFCQNIVKIRPLLGFHN